MDISATSPIGSQITYNAHSDTSAVSTSMEAQTLNVTTEQNWHGTSTITVYVSDENNLYSYRRMIKKGQSDFGRGLSAIMIKE